MKACRKGVKACCPAAIVESEKTCKRSESDNCVIPRRDPLPTFNGVKKDEGRENDLVDIVIAGDRIQSLGVIACARSVFASTRRPDRIVLHVVTDTESAAEIK